MNLQNAICTDIGKPLITTQQSKVTNWEAGVLGEENLIFKSLKTTWRSWMNSFSGISDVYSPSFWASKSLH